MRKLTDILSLLATLWLLSVASSVVFAQGPQHDTLYRSARQAGAKISVEGVGFDLCLFDHLGLDATSFIIYNAAKARFLILSKNATPIVGVGVGGRSAGPGGSDGREWTVLFVGWEHGYESIFFQFIVQYPVYKSIGGGTSPFPLNVAIGIRF